MKVAEAIVQIMVKEGIQDAFGIPGAGINPVYKYMENAPIEHYCMRHEEACVHAADGYYRAKHKIALAICTSGPGATNFVTGLYTANIDSIPVLAITGQANSWQLKQDAFQCVDMVSIASSVCKKVYCPLEAEKIPEIMREAFYLMRSGKPGPVLLDLPLDIQQQEIEFDIEQYEPKAIQKISASYAEIEKVLDMIEEAKMPAIIMGGGVILSKSEEKLIQFAEKLQIPIIQTYMAKGGVPINHPLNAGHAGIQVGQPIGNKIFLESDLIIGIGNRFTDRHTGNLEVYRHGRKFIHIDIEPTQIGKVFQPDLGIVSDAKIALEMLLEVAEKRNLGAVGRKEIEKLPEWRKELARKTDFDDTPIKPHRVFKELNEVFDENTMFTAGCGITQIWSGQLQEINRPRRYLPSGGAGTLGFEVPAAFGAKVADPTATSVTVLGDFGFTFMGEEIAVSAAYEKPMITVIVNNAYLGLIRQNQKVAYDFEYGVDMPYNQNGLIDYVKVAEGYGCVGERVFTPDELRLALEKAKKSEKSVVIDVICEPEQLCDMGVALDNIRNFGD
ncbi:tartronate-semialdehyde synthase [Pilibacter termitis]|uniref:Tartronate-semialdehyde synthase n=1 Tax=Pilibacter termitis TaxID=263852 RepID=A0A1T4LCP6_9ENTE|nr:thiamine pyrophosphate-dependent enzyme [Pilibacter termitis]SJZ52413.1 tartronate-semialdehyde synthase [Pilibacter termitis]